MTEPNGPQLPITMQNVQEWFPAAAAENPFVGEAWWQLQGLGLLAAITMLRLTPDTEARQQALVELRRAIDTALLSVPAPPDEEVQRRLAQSLAPFAPTPWPIVEAMLDLAQLKPGERLLDLGSGDGRIVLEASKRGAHAIGVEIDAVLIGQARERVTENPEYQRASFIHADVHHVEFGDPDVVTCYLTSAAMVRLAPRLRQLKPGTRIVSHAFDMPNWEEVRQILCGESVLYLWVV